jgi:hypothetical protein
MDLDPNETDVTILAGDSLSGVIDLQLERLHRVDMPAAWDAASLSFAVASQAGAAFLSLYQEGTEYAVAAGPNRSIVVDQAVFLGVRFLKIRSGVNGAPVPQTADRLMKLVTSPL